MQFYKLLTPLRRTPAGATIPLDWDDGEALVNLGAAVRVDAETIAPVTNDVDRDARTQELLRELGDLTGYRNTLRIAAVPNRDGMYLMTITAAGVTDVQPYEPAADPLASDDPAVIRRHHLDALRDLDDRTYLVFDDSAAADLGGLVLLSMDADTGIVTSVTARSAAAVGIEVVDQPFAGTGEAIQSDGATEGDGQPIPPVAIVPADDGVLATMTKAQLLGEAGRVSATFDTGMTKPQLVEAIQATRVVE